MCLGFFGYMLINKIDERNNKAQLRAKSDAGKHLSGAKHTETGILTIKTNPSGAFVVIDGNKTLPDKTPLTVKLEAGKNHQLTIVHQECEIMLIEKEFFKQSKMETFEVSLVPIHRKSVIVKAPAVLPKTSKIAQVAKPVAKRVPQKVANLKIEVAKQPQNPPQLADKPVTTIKKEPVSEVAKEEAVSPISGAVLSIQSNVSNFNYSISGEGIDVPPSLTNRKTLRRTGFAPGQYNLVISKDGYVAQEMAITLTEGKVTQINVDLVKDFK